MEILNARHNMTLLKEGQELTCMTSGIRPPATITWYIDGQKVNNGSLITYSTSGNDTELYTSYSSLRLMGNSSVETRIVYCEGSNIREQSPVQSESVRVQTLCKSISCIGLHV
ncbi:hypothetical protein FSP39_010581 [Pinctada imbricata]|uniref:Ig-like domain-containing protein n=1 Tax=Pinctada imbricata TaxID=66713 RepID=A0AA88Y8G4_PINIB|nr:hypothetical protein FSP39_010581 [Pinctada imbricata]